MSAPDYLFLVPRAGVLPQMDGFPHRLALLPNGASLGALGWQSAAFLIEPDCAREALNDPALEGYLTAKVPVLFFARRARDLRPVLRRTEALRARGYLVEVLQ
jgi:hypothetical protein